MKDFTTITIVTKQEEVPFKTVRRTLGWRSSDRSSTPIFEMDSVHITNCINLLRGYCGNHIYQGITVKVWRQVFNNEKRYRALQQSIDNYKVFIKEHRISMDKLLNS